jgi:predicted lipoprotein with Yx(FWY)xxD motif
MRTTPRLLLSLALPITLILAACSSSGGASTPPTTAPTVAPTAAPASQAPASAEPSAEAPDAGGGGSIVLADNALGKILVDGDESSKTIYAFTPDTAGTPTCYDSCAENWPPALAEGTPTVGAGLDAALLTTVDRTDGTKQLKYGDWPLYYFAGDNAAGDTNGQGLSSKWYVIGADGKLIGQ